MVQQRKLTTFFAPPHTSVVAKPSLQKAPIAPATASKRIVKELETYSRKQHELPWLPNIIFPDPDTRPDRLECLFHIPNHLPFKLLITVVDGYPFKPLRLHVDPVPDELYEYELQQELFFHREDHSPATHLLFLVQEIWKFVTAKDKDLKEVQNDNQNDNPTEVSRDNTEEKEFDPRWKGKGKQKYMAGTKRQRSPSPPPVPSPSLGSRFLPSSSSQQHPPIRKKLPIIERILSYQRLREEESEAQYESDLAKALAASVGHTL